jgi:hypothetical protein
MEEIRSSETSVLTNNTRRKIPEDCLLKVSEFIGYRTGLDFIKSYAFSIFIYLSILNF